MVVIETLAVRFESNISDSSKVNPRSENPPYVILVLADILATMHAKQLLIVRWHVELSDITETIDSVILRPAHAWIKPSPHFSRLCCSNLPV